MVGILAASGIPRGIRNLWGITVSAKWMVTLGAAGVAIALVLSLWGFFLPGPGGVNFAPFNPVKASSRSGLYLAVIFSIFAFNGWESVAPLAEESENPRRNLPRAILISILVKAASWSSARGDCW